VLTRITLVFIALLLAAPVSAAAKQYSLACTITSTLDLVDGSVNRDGPEGPHITFTFIDKQGKPQFVSMTHPACTKHPNNITEYRVDDLSISLFCDSISEKFNKEKTKYKTTFIIYINRYSGDFSYSVISPFLKHMKKGQCKKLKKKF